MKVSDLPFFWVLPSWGVVMATYFNAAWFYLWKKTGVNMWSISWAMSFNNIKIEKRFAEEIRNFPKLNAGYQLVKWGSPILLVGYITWIMIWIFKR